ncbi:MAG TPA: glycosyltransferase [candidate division Zixibacteria bacterium]|nr:glycosyltransferase [candidate division Zixibacteria bacterium]HPM38562.1 glycosyltransferase [candidate division Zixibacteria bacterium]
MVRPGRFRTAGERIGGGLGQRLTRVANSVFVLDTLLPDLFAPVRQRRGWFLDAFAGATVAQSVQWAASRLGIGAFHLVSFNAYAGNLAARLSPVRSLFDAWDNFLKFPANAQFRKRLEQSYRMYAECTDVWSTNSATNREVFCRLFEPGACEVIRNGVDPDHFRTARAIPADLAALPRPIIGLGAKITHLVDYDLLNAVMAANPDLSFVVIGQVLDKAVMGRIKPLPNFHYLGDKHYDVYPAYVGGFDAAIVPYVVGAREHGGDSIKTYEYLAAGKPVVSTPIDGLLKCPGRIFPARSPEEFGAAIRKALSAGDQRVEIPAEYLWSTKAEEMMDLLVRPRRPRTRRTHRPIVAFCGTRGVPARYGGFETAVDQISRRFAARGYDCEIICRRSAAGPPAGVGSRPLPDEHEGRRLVYVDGHRSRTLDTFAAALQTGRHLWRRRRAYRHVFWFNNANLPGILLSALARIPMSVNTDGLEWRRSKWSWPFKLYYRLASGAVALICRRLISDSRGIQDYYRRTLFRSTEFIPYGAPEPVAIDNERAEEILARYDLAAGKYFLQITRIEPDNLPVRVAEAFVRAELVRQGFRMVFIGYREDTPYARKLAVFDGRFGVRVHAAQYDPEVLQALRSRCWCYVHGNSVGGTNPALLEAMAACPRVVAIDCVFSREVLGDCGRLFDPDNIAPTLLEALAMPDESARMRRRVAERYDWEAVATAYMNLAEGRPAAYRPTAPSEENPARRPEGVPAVARQGEVTV